jgi:RHS repeat-associated protein
LTGLSESIPGNTNETSYSYQQNILVSPFSVYNIGNLIQKGGSSRTEAYNGRRHQVTASWLGNYTYESNGNRVSNPTYASYTYDGENRLLQLGCSAILSNTYDADGIRVIRWTAVDGATTHFVGDTYGNKDVGATWTPTVYYQFGGVPVAMKQGSTLYYLHRDHLGSLVSLTDASANEKWWGRYYPHGGLRLTGGSTSTQNLPTDRLFTGQTRDLSASNLDAHYFFKSPYDDATIGRFHVPDSVVPGAGNPQALNRYAYALNNPLRFVDPSGHFTEDELKKWGYTQAQIDLWKKDDPTWYAILSAGKMGDIVTGYWPYTSGNPMAVAGMFAIRPMTGSANGQLYLAGSKRNYDLVSFGQQVNQNRALWRYKTSACGWALVTAPNSYLRAPQPGDHFNALPGGATEASPDLSEDLHQVLRPIHDVVEFTTGPLYGQSPFSEIALTDSLAAVFATLGADPEEAEPFSTAITMGRLHSMLFMPYFRAASIGRTTDGGATAVAEGETRTVCADRCGRRSAAVSQEDARMAGDHRIRSASSAIAPV